MYALVFTSAYSEAQARLDEIRCNLVHEANGVHTAMQLVCAIETTNEAHKTRTLLLFASYIFQLGDEIGHDPDWIDADDEGEDEGGSEGSSIETLFAAVPYLSLMCADVQSTRGSVGSAVQSMRDQLITDLSDPSFLRADAPFSAFSACAAGVHLHRPNAAVEVNDLGLEPDICTFLRTPKIPR